MAKRPGGFRIDNPAWVLVQALISYWGITDADGGAGGTTLLCGDLVNQPDFNGNHVVIISGPYGGQARDINGSTIAGTVTPNLAFGGVITAGTIFTILPIRTTPAEVAAIAALIGTAADDGDLSTLFAKHKQILAGVHVYVLLVVADASSLDTSKDTALKDLLLDQGYKVVIADPTDIAGNLELAFDFIVVSGSIISDANLGNLRNADCPVMCHSAEVAVSANVFSLGATAATKAAQTQIEIMDNTPIWLITTSTGNLTVTASATIETMATKATNALTLAEEANGTNLLTMVRLLQGVADDSGYIANFDRYFIGITDFTAANAVFKALMVELWEHVIHEVRFAEVVVTPKRVYQEQIPDTDVSDTATTTEAECILLEIGPRNNRRFCLRDFRLKAQADPAGNTMTVRLYEYFDGTLITVDSFDIDTGNWGTYHSLMDMFGVPEVHSDAIKITGEMAPAGAVDVKATYSFAEAKK